MATLWMWWIPAALPLMICICFCRLSDLDWITVSRLPPFMYSKTMQMQGETQTPISETVFGWGRRLLRNDWSLNRKGWQMTYRMTLSSPKKSSRSLLWTSFAGFIVFTATYPPLYLACYSIIRDDLKASLSVTRETLPNEPAPRTISKTSSL